MISSIKEFCHIHVSQYNVLFFASSELQILLYKIEGELHHKGYDKNL